MKCILFCIFFGFLSCKSFNSTPTKKPTSNPTQSTEPVTTETELIVFTEDPQNKQFKLTHKKSGKRFDSLKFAGLIGYEYYQILDKNNNLFYLKPSTIDSNGVYNDDDWDKKTKVDDDFGREVCGSVNFYTLSVQENIFYYKIIKEIDTISVDFSDSFFKKRTIKKISKNKADSVLLFNGKKELHYSDNSWIGVVGNIEPEIIILVKDGKYFTEDNPTLKYDSIDFTNGWSYLKTKKGNLYGLLRITEPKYTKIDQFECYLAKAELPNGKEVIIDLEGNEY